MKRFLITVTMFILLFSTNVQAAVSENKIEKDDFYVLSHVIACEAGAEYCTDELMYYVGSVVLNRVEHEAFPDSIHEVVFQPGQYQCAKTGKFKYEPSDRVVRITRELLSEGSKLPDHVVFQANFIQGDDVYCKKQGVYFCTLN